MNKQLIIPYTRWEELINKVSTELWISGVPVEEINIVVSVLKNNTPFEVVYDNKQNVVSNVENKDLGNKKMDLSFVEYCDLSN